MNFSLYSNFHNFHLNRPSNAHGCYWAPLILSLVKAKQPPLEKIKRVYILVQLLTHVYYNVFPLLPEKSQWFPKTIQQTKSQRSSSFRIEFWAQIKTVYCSANSSDDWYIHASTLRVLYPSKPLSVVLLALSGSYILTKCVVLLLNCDTSAQFYDRTIYYYLVISLLSPYVILNIQLEYICAHF